MATYLHLNPKDEVQNRNKEFYDGVDEVTQDMFVPRKVRAYVCVCLLPNCILTGLNFSCVPMY